MDVKFLERIPSTRKRLYQFAACAGIDDKASTSVTLISKDGVVAWSYSVNKGRGSKKLQSMAEAVAKHLKDDFFAKNK